MNSYRISLRLAQTNSTFKPVSLFEKLPIHLPSGTNKTNRTEAAEHSGGKTTNDWRFGPITIDWMDQEMSSMESSGPSTQEKKGSSSSIQCRKSAEGGILLIVWDSQYFTKM